MSKVYTKEYVEHLENERDKMLKLIVGLYSEDVDSHYEVQQFLHGYVTEDENFVEMLQNMEEHLLVESDSDEVACEFDYADDDYIYITVVYLTDGVVDSDEQMKMAWCKYTEYEEMNFH